MVTKLEEKKKTTPKSLAEQETKIESGNEMAALAAKQINFHVMGYYPITPSTQIAETLDAMKAAGDHGVMMIPGDGEHGAAGICYGATTAGGRVMNATSANGLLYAIEQLPVQSGTRYPMVLNIVCRSVSGPLDIKGDHSDVMSALNMGWIILMAKDPQMVYDLNIIAVKVGEAEGVRLPVIVAFDGFFISHQKRKVKYFKDDKTVQDFIGEFKVMNSSVDPKNPMTIGPYMNEPDLINNKKQLSLAFEEASCVIPKILDEYAAISGRKYNMVETYRMEDCEAAIFSLGSAYDTCRVAVEHLRKEGHKVGTISLTTIRPFPRKELLNILKNVKSLIVMDRADNPGAGGGNMTLEVKAALKDDSDNKTLISSKVFGIGGREFLVEEAEEILKESLEVAKRGKVIKEFDFWGADEGEKEFRPKKFFDYLPEDEANPNLELKFNEETGQIDSVKGIVARKLSQMPNRIVSGHGACPGCGIFPNITQFLRGIEGHVVLLIATGCAMVVTTGYPFTSHRVTYIHNLFQSGAATLSGVVEMYKERQRRGEIPSDQKITFIYVCGDGSNDIGMGSTIGAAVRGHNMIILEYDNEGYMNTGAQLSYSTPIGHRTSTSNVGPYQAGKNFQHKDTAQIMAATHIPYVFTATESNFRDMITKAAKAQYYALNEGMAYGKILSACPLNWISDPSKSAVICGKAVDCNFFPLYEVEHGITKITYNPEEKGKKVDVEEWLKIMGKTKHLLKPENKEILEAFRKEVERRWARLKAMHDNPVL